MTRSSLLRLRLTVTATVTVNIIPRAIATHARAPAQLPPIHLVLEFVLVRSAL
jgi:hypothetical protein